MSETHSAQQTLWACWTSLNSSPLCPHLYVCVISWSEPWPRINLKMKCGSQCEKCCFKNTSKDFRLNAYIFFQDISTSWMWHNTLIGTSALFCEGPLEHWTSLEAHIIYTLISYLKTLYSSKLAGNAHWLVYKNSLTQFRVDPGMTVLLLTLG